MYDVSDDPARLDRDWVVGALSTQAYWGLWRTREQVEAQIDSAWRVIGAYVDGVQVGSHARCPMVSASPISPM